jgi:hypothetical protein
VAETATHKRPILRIADIFRRHRKALEAKHALNLGQRRLLGAIVACRTPALGAQLHVCTTCQAVHPVYLSCRKRGCPNCQALAQEQWIAARRERILPVRHFHLVFTLPAELRRLAMAHPALLYGAFFRIVGAILEEMGRDHLKATLGWTMVLHTWRRDLGPHIHIHALVTAGGLLLDGSAFQHVAGLYLFSGEAMGILLRGKMMAALREYQAEGAFPELDDHAFNELMARLARHPSWVVHAEPPFRDPTHLLNYLGRYVHRIALSDSRLVEASHVRVTFTTRDGNTASMDPVRFMHRFLQHVLPQGFHKVRHGGLYASTRKGGRLDQARAFLEQEVDPEEAAKWQRGTAETMAKLVFEGHPCPDCGGTMERTNVRIPGLRAPPGGCDA